MPIINLEGEVLFHRMIGQPQKPLTMKPPTTIRSVPEAASHTTAITAPNLLPRNNTTWVGALIPQCGNRVVEAAGVEPASEKA